MHKILVIRFSSIGDIVLTSPVIRCLKAQLPFTEIHFLTKEEYHPLLVANPYIDKIHLMEDGLSTLIPKLKAEHFNYIIDLHHNLRTLKLKTRLGLKIHSFPKLNIEKWMMVNFKINNLPKEHIVDRYFETCKGLKIKNDGKGLDYFIPKHDEVNLNFLPKSHQEGYIGFVIGAKHVTKQFPADKIISVCKKMNQPVVLLGGKQDKEMGDKIKSETGNLVYNSCGEFNINQSASLIKQARKVITNDTGLMHVAAAFNKEIISIWGNTIPEFGMSPYMPQTPNNSTIMEVKGLNCRPCSKLGFDKCPKGHFKCMNLIDEEEIVRTVNS
jgi:ADP-heptose:LPS heptosyltransferase